MKYYFGQPFEYFFYVLDPESNSSYDYLDIAAAAPTVYLYFSDTQPTRAQVKAGTLPVANIIQTVNAWSAIPNSKGKRIEFDAIPETLNTDNDSIDTFWVCVQYQIDPNSETLIDIKQLQLFRPTTISRIINVRIDDVVRAFPRIKEYTDCQGTDIPNAIELAIEDTLEDLSFCDDIKYQLIEPEQLNSVIKYKALAILCKNNISVDGDNWTVWYEDYNKTAKRKLGQLRLKLENDANGTPDHIRQSTTGIIRWMR